MTGGGGTAVVDTAAGHDGHIRAVSDIEIIIHQLGKSGLA